MDEYKIFKPDIVFKDAVGSLWSQNIKTFKNKIPISLFFKKKGIWALDISPIYTESLYIFALPINKRWEPKTFMKDVNLCFSIFSENPIFLNIRFQDDKLRNSDFIDIEIENRDIDIWKNFSVPVLIKENLRLIIFSGSAELTPSYTIKDIVINE